MSFIDKITQSSQNVINKAKDKSEISSIKSKINQEKKIIKDNFSRLGELYYQNYKENADNNQDKQDNHDEKLIEICSLITESEAKIQAFNLEIEEIENSITCLKCGAKQPVGTAFCGACGEAFAKEEVKQFCSGCGKQMSPTATFCSNCGTKA